MSYTPFTTQVAGRESGSSADYDHSESEAAKELKLWGGRMPSIKCAYSCPRCRIKTVGDPDTHYCGPEPRIFAGDLDRIRAEEKR